ncbi:MAG TPA: HAMP domain-containing sensor histidine kinase [Longimicrobium sp.]|nr:HAMP domain-containing sensor histidine kinase [Longimicrobium sp.]
MSERMHAGEVLYMRTPINAVIGYAELLQMELAGPLTEMQRDYLVRVRGASRHLLALIGDVLDLSRVEAGEMQVGKNAVRLRETVNGALDLVFPQATEAGVEIEFDPCPDAVFRGDPGRVGQILVNLLSNAVKFTESGGRVRVICTVTDDAEVQGGGDGPWIRTDVEDTGIGIAPEHAEVIFDPFYQVEGGYTRESGGTGLGLAISRRLARLMGGDVTLHSRPGEGSRFTLWLPAALEAHASGSDDPST